MRQIDFSENFVLEMKTVKEIKTFFVAEPSQRDEVFKTGHTEFD